jgi:hypothetical protein
MRNLIQAIELSVKRNLIKNRERLATTAATKQYDAETMTNWLLLLWADSHSPTVKNLESLVL